MRQRLPIPIALVLNDFERGGTEHQMTELICRLDPSVFTVYVACLRDEGPLRARVDAAGIPVTEFPLRGFKSAGAVRQLFRFAGWCGERQIQVLQTADFYGNVFALTGAALAGVPVRIGSRRNIVTPERTAGQALLQRLCCQLAHRVVANSAAAAERLIEEGTPDWKVVRIANGIDVARFPTAPETSRRRVITTVANLRPGKGHDVLLKAAARVLRRVPDARFHIVGDGPRRQELERLASVLRISGQVRFFGRCDRVPKVLGESDIFAFPSFMEASPNAVLEAMAAGLPVVATRVGGVPEIIDHDRNGLLVAPRDDRALAAALLRLIDRPTLATRLGHAARRTVETRFSFDRMAGEFESLYLGELAARVAPEVLTWAASSGS